MSGTKRIITGPSGTYIDTEDTGKGGALDFFLNRILQPLTRQMLALLNRLAADGLSVSASATLTGAEGLVLVDASVGPVTITLCAPDALFHLLIVQKVDASGNAVTVAAPAGATIRGVASLPLAAQWDRLIIVADDSAFYA